MAITTKTILKNSFQVTIILHQSQPKAIQHDKQYRLPGRGPIQSFPFKFSLRFSSPQNLFYSIGRNCQALYENNGSVSEKQQWKPIALLGNS